MKKRTTIELDPDLVARAKEALGKTTTRETVEEALRRAAESSEHERRLDRSLQLRYLKRLNRTADVDVMRSDEMWR